MTPFFARYRALKARGKITVSKIGSAYAVTLQRFDPETGDPEAQEIESLDIAQVDGQIAQHRRLIAELQALKADIEALG